MISQLFMAKSGFFSYERKMQVITNNIANSQTPGYKKHRMELESLFPLVLERSYTEFDEAAPGPTRKRKKFMEYGQGVRIVDIRKDFSTGTIEITNQPLDMAIEGRGLFQVRIPDGSTAYTRAGNFHMDAEGNILDPNGHPMEPSIKVPRNVTDVVINEEGRVFVQVGDEAQPREVGQILLANFQNENGLKEIGQNLYVETPASGQPELVIPGRDGVGAVKQRALEFSNVNIIEELMTMLLTQRAFELITKTINMSDSMLKVASDIGK